MLFDAAFASKGDELVQYIQNLGIDYIDVLVLSYPHDDHMGGAAEVLNNIEVGKIYGPDIFDIESLDTNDWYSEMLDAIKIPLIIEEIKEKQEKNIQLFGIYLKMKLRCNEEKIKLNFKKYYFLKDLEKMKFNESQ